MPDAPLAFIKDCISGGRVRWTYHVTASPISVLNGGMLRDAMGTLEIVEAYPHDVIPKLEQATMSRVDQLLTAVDVSAELEVIRYAA